MAWSINSVAQASPSATSPRTINYSGTTNRLYVVALSRSTAADPFTTVTDNVGNTWTRGTFAPTSGSVGRRIELWYCIPTDAFSTITIAFTGAGQAQATLIEINGHDTPPVDAINSGFSSASTTPTPVTITPSAAGTLVLAAIQANSNTDGQITTNAGWTRLSTNNQGPALAYRTDAPSGAAIGVTWTLTASVGSGQAIMSVLPGAGGPPPDGPTLMVWNGTAEVSATIEGVWNGSTLQPVDSVATA